MAPAFGLMLILVGVALMWVALHGYESSKPGFRGVWEGIYGGIKRATE